MPHRAVNVEAENISVASVVPDEVEPMLCGPPPAWQAPARVEVGRMCEMFESHPPEFRRRIDSLNPPPIPDGAVLIFHRGGQYLDWVRSREDTIGIVCTNDQLLYEQSRRKTSWKYVLESQFETMVEAFIPWHTIVVTDDSATRDLVYTKYPGVKSVITSKWFTLLSAERRLHVIRGPDWIYPWLNVDYSVHGTSLVTARQQLEYITRVECWDFYAWEGKFMRPRDEWAPWAVGIGDDNLVGYVNG